MAHMYDRVVTIISKPAEERTEMEVDHILPWFRKKSDLFRNLQPEVVKDIVKNCQFETLQKDSVVIRQGDKGDRFYIILNGGVSIYINPALSDADNDALHKKAQEQLARATEEPLSEEGVREKKKLDLSKFGNFIGKIDAGKSFGELALINKDCVRNASIITDVCTDLLVVDRTLYNRSLHAYQAQDFAQRSQFTAQYPLFSNWQPRYKKQMAMSLRKDIVPYDGTIVKQGDPVDNVYFLLSGQVKILVDPGQHQSQFPHYYPLENLDQIEQEEARTSIRKESVREKPRFLDKVSKTPSLIRKANLEKKLQRQLELCVIGAVEIIGDLEVIMDLGTYTHTAVCTQEAEVLVLNMKNYERLLLKRNPKTVDSIREIVETKLDIRCSRYTEHQIPLLKYLLYKLRCVTKPRKDPPSIWDRPAVETSWNVPNSHRGPIIDLYGPGTVFHMIRMRDKARRHARARVRFLAGGGRNRIDVKKQADNGNGAKIHQGADIGITIEDVGVEPDALVRGGTLYDSREFGHRQTDENLEDAIDYITNDMALSQLEEKIRSWHCGFEGPSKATKRTVKLHRYNPEENLKPKPGKKVFIRKRNPKSVNLDDGFGLEEDDSLLKVPENNVHSKHHSQRSLHSRMTESYTSPVSDTDDESDGDQRTADKPTTKVIRRKKKDSRRKYTPADYQALRETLRQKQRTFGVEVNRISRATTSLS